MKSKIIKTNGNQALVNYGQGIFMDFNEMGLAGKKLNGELKVEASYGDLSETKLEGYSSAFVLHIHKENLRRGLLELNLRQLGENSSGYLKIAIDGGCRVGIIENITVSDYANIKIEIFAGKNSTVDYYALQNIALDKYLAVERRANLDNDAKMKVFEMNFGGKIVKSSVVNNLNGAGAEVEVHGLFAGNDNQHFDLYNSNIHLADHSISKMMARGVANGHSKAIYRSMIKIEKDAVKSSGHQRLDTLLLSPTAEIDAIPNLEIGNNQVKCSHGATTASLDKEKMFYLASRGVSELQARQMLIFSHLEPVIQKINDEALREKIAALIEQKINS